MSFAVSVAHPHVPQLIDFASASHEEIERWLEDERKFTVYEAAIAADGAFYSCYAVLASQMGLPLLVQTYEHGLRLNTKDDLTRFMREIELIEAAWHQGEFLAQWRDEPYGASRWERLQEGATDLKHAIRLALEQHLELHLG